MKNIIYISLVALLVLSFSCQQKDGLLYDTTQKDIVFLQRNSGTSYSGNMSVVTNRTYADSSVYSMSNLAATVTEVNLGIVIKLLGNVVDYDRKIALEINEELTTADIGEGKDIEIDLDTVYLKAGATTAQLRFKVNRTARLSTEQVVLAVNVLTNENFDTMEEYRRSDRDYADETRLSGITYRYKVSDIASEPWIYSIFGPGFFGPWEIVKYNTINAQMGWTHHGWENNWNKAGAYPSYGKLPYAAAITQTYLQEMADKGTPVIDSNGEYVQLAGVYVVDYSAYL